MTSVDFERFVGIDWSGSKGRSHEGIQIAELSKGNPHPNLLPPNGHKNWSRAAVVEYIKSLKRRTLVGIDFAFSVPAPFPVPNLSEPRKLWALVDEICIKAIDGDTSEYYGGPVWLSEDSPFRPYMRYANYRGDLFDGKRLRQTEQACRPRATSVYKLMYSQVGRGSFAGMRVLKSLSNEIAIWPFDEIGSANVVVVEVYPSAFYVMAACKRPNPEKQARESVDTVINDVLRHFGTTCGNDRPRSQDEIDAYITSAALAHLSRDASSFAIPADLRDVVAQEGWIFGVPFGGLA